MSACHPQTWAAIPMRRAFRPFRLINNFFTVQPGNVLPVVGVHIALISNQEAHNIHPVPVALCALYILCDLVVVHSLFLQKITPSTASSAAAAAHAPQAHKTRSFIPQSPLQTTTISAPDHPFRRLQQSRTNSFSTALILLDLSNVVVSCFCHMHLKSSGASYSLHKTMLFLLIFRTQSQYAP